MITGKGLTPNVPSLLLPGRHWKQPWDGALCDRGQVPVFLSGTKRGLTVPALPAWWFRAGQRRQCTESRFTLKWRVHVSSCWNSEETSFQTLLSLSKLTALAVGGITQRALRTLRPCCAQTSCVTTLGQGSRPMAFFQSCSGGPRCSRLRTSDSLSFPLPAGAGAGDGTGAGGGRSPGWPGP